MKPTAGPYEIVSHPDEILITSDAADIAEVFDVCDKEEQFANARLLAASWSMLQELKRLQEIFGLSDESRTAKIIRKIDSGEYMLRRENERREAEESTCVRTRKEK